MSCIELVIQNGAFHPRTGLPISQSVYPKKWKARMETRNEKLCQVILPLGVCQLEKIEIIKI